MVRTKKQAKARQSESAQKSAVVNDGGGSRVDTKTGGAEGGDGASSASSSERARRADRREKATRLMAEATSARDDDIQHRAETAAADDEDGQSGDFHKTPATGGTVSENYYTALEGLGEDADTEESGGGVYLRPPTSIVRSHRDGRDSEVGSRSGEDMTGS